MSCVASLGQSTHFLHQVFKSIDFSISLYSWRPSRPHFLPYPDQNHWSITKITPGQISAPAPSPFYNPCLAKSQLSTMAFWQDSLLIYPPLLTFSERLPHPIIKSLSPASSNTSSFFPIPVSTQTDSSISHFLKSPPLTRIPHQRPLLSLLLFTANLSLKGFLHIHIHFLIAHLL